MYYLTESLAEETVGIEMIDQYRGAIFFGKIKLGILDAKLEKNSQALLICDLTVKDILGCTYIASDANPLGGGSVTINKIAWREVFNYISLEPYAHLYPPTQMSSQRHTDKKRES